MKSSKQKPNKRSQRFSLNAVFINEKIPPIKENAIMATIMFIYLAPFCVDSDQSLAKIFTYENYIIELIRYTFQ